MRSIVLLLFTLFSSLMPAIAKADEHAETTPKEAVQADETTSNACPLPLPRDRLWRPQEKWAWEERLCLGLRADMRVYFQTRLKRQLPCTPNDPKSFPPEATLSNRFLEAIVRSPGLVTVGIDTADGRSIEIDSYQDLLPSRGVEIFCAYFRDGIDLENAKLNKPLVIAQSRIENAVNMQRLQTTSFIVLLGDVFEGIVQAYALSTDDDLLIWGGTVFRAPVSLISAKIGGNFEIKGSAMAAALSAENISVGGSFRLREGSQLRSIDLNRARIGNILHISETTLLGKLDGDGLEVGGFVQFRNKATFDEISMVSAKVGGSMDTVNAVFNKPVTAYGMEVGGSMFLREASFNDINLSSARIGGSLELRGSVYNGRVDLTDARIEHEFHIASPLPSTQQTENRQNYDPPRWGDHSELILRNLRTEALQDTAEAWDNLDGRLDLVGFTYTQLGGLRSTRDNILAARPIEWMLDWLGKQKDREDVYQPQPYEQLSKVLRDGGWIEKANEVLIARNNHQLLHETTPWGTKAWLAVKWAVIGYGLEVWLSIVWLFGLQAIGTLVMVASPVGREIGWARSAFYAIDTSMPFVELNPLVHNELSERSSQTLKYYFAVHRVLGLILMTFLAAGMSGLTTNQ